MRWQARIAWVAPFLAFSVGGCSKPVPPAAEATAKEAEPRLDPAADARLRAMSDTLAGVETFSFSATQRREQVDAAGEKTVRESNRELLAVRPDRFRERRITDGVTAFAIYDGSTLTLQGDREKVWAQVDMPPTLDEALDYLAEVYRMPMPIADLVYSDPYGSIVGDDTSLRMVGKEKVGGAECDHLVIETPAVIADVWLEGGERALPCKLELVPKEAADAPRTSLEFRDWNLSPEVDAALFAFTPPAGYNRIPMVAVMSPEEEKRAREAAANREEAPVEPPGSSGS